MTTVDATNVHAIAIEGTFDDCQAIVKAHVQRPAFRDGDAACRRQLDQLGAGSSPRSSTTSPRPSRSARRTRAVSFTVPTGNFGDIFAGYVAKRMGLPIDRLVIATNVNDILARTLASGATRSRGVTPTTSPVDGHPGLLQFRAAAVRGARARRRRRAAADGGLGQSGRFAMPPRPPRRDPRRLRRRPRRRGGDRRDDRADARAMPASCADPHTAVGIAVAPAFAAPDTPMVTLATAHPAKFPDAVEGGDGHRPAAAGVAARTS